MVPSKYTQAEHMVELLRKLMEYRSHEVRHRLEKVGRAASMLHMDVLLRVGKRDSEGGRIRSRNFV